MSFAARLVAARHKAGISQAELAKRVGVSAGTVANWESVGEHGHGIRMDRIKLVAETLGIQVAELVA